MSSSQPSFLKLVAATLLCLGLLEGLLHLPVVEGFLESKNFNEVSHKLTLLNTYRRTHGRPPDVVMFGTSRTRYGFETATFDKIAPLHNGSFNLGVSAATPFLYWMWLPNYVAHYGKPKLLLLEVPEFSLNKNHRDSSVQYYLRGLAEANFGQFWKTVLNSAMQTQEKVDLLLYSQVNLYRYKNLLHPLHMSETVFSHKKPKRIAQKEAYSCAGWLANGSRYRAGRSQQQLKKFRNVMLAHYVPDSGALRQTLEYARRLNIPVALVQWPVRSEYRALTRSMQIDGPYLREIDQISRLYNVPFINLNASQDTGNVPVFADSHHLTPAGAKMMTATLARQVAPILSGLQSGKPLAVR